MLYIILKSGVSFVLIFWCCREYKREEREEKNIIILNYIYVYIIFNVNKLEILIYRWMFIYLYLICDFYYMGVNGYYFFVRIKFLYNL